MDTIQMDTIQMDEWSPGSGLLLENNNNNNISNASSSLSSSSRTRIIIDDPESNINGHCKICRIAFSDGILMTVSWIIAFRMVGVFVFLNEFPYVSDNIYHYGQQISGLMIGIGSIFTILGASVAILCDRDENNKKTSERSSLLFKLSPKNKKLSIMRMASIISLISCILLLLPPILQHYSSFLRVLEINADIAHLKLINEIYTNNPWYFMVIPFCVLTFSQGLFIPPATVVVLEPYPHIAGSISAILQFWRIILPTLTLILITQCLSYETNNIASITIHGIIGFCAFLCFVLMYGCISGHDVRLRMCGWQDRLQSQCEQSIIDIIETYGTGDNNKEQTHEITKGVTVMQSVDISTSIPGNIDFDPSNVRLLSSRSINSTNNVPTMQF